MGQAVLPVDELPDGYNLQLFLQQYFVPKKWVQDNHQDLTDQLFFF